MKNQNTNTPKQDNKTNPQSGGGKNTS